MNYKGTWKVDTPNPSRHDPTISRGAISGQGPGSVVVEEEAGAIGRPKDGKHGESRAHHHQPCLQPALRKQVMLITRRGYVPSADAAAAAQTGLVGNCASRCRHRCSRLLWVPPGLQRPRGSQYASIGNSCTIRRQVGNQVLGKG